MTSPSVRAQELFAEHVRRLEAGESSYLDEACRETPELEVELRQLESEWSRMSAVLARLSPTKDPLSERLRAEYGDEVDPEISLSQGGFGGIVDESSAALMGKLSAQGGAERYLTRHEIARGGMGAILKVWDEDLRRPLAMKVVLREDGGTSGAATDSGSQKRLTRFLEEAQITSQLDHPGIVPVHDLGIDPEGRVYFTMQLVDGRDVKDIIALAEKKEEGWDQRRVVGVLIRVCEALAYAHSKGVVHRDIKPGNVMVGKFGEVFLMDWGLAKVMGREEELDGQVSSIMQTLRSDHSSAEQTLAGDVVGTPAFMAPEQAFGRAEEVGPASDLYAVGAILYYMLAGQLPYQPLGESVGAFTVLQAVKSGPPWPVHKLRPEAPAELVAICEKAMAREIEDRFSDSMTLAGELRDWLEGNAVATYETSAFYSVRKWIGRNKGMSLALSGIVAVLIGSLSIFFTQQQRSIDDLKEEQVLTEAAQAEAGLNLEKMKEEAERANRERDRAEERQREAFESKMLVQSLADNQRMLAEKSRGAGYRAQIIAAWFSLRLHEASQTRQRLRDADLGLRGWEWGYLSLNVDASTMEPLKHEAGSYQLLSSGGLVASMGLDGSMRVFDPKDWSFVDHATAGGFAAGGLFFNPNALASSKRGGVPCAVSDSGVLVTAGYSPIIRLWNSTDFSAMGSLRVSNDDDPIVSLAISDDGLFVASVDVGGSLRVWSVALEVPVLEREVAADLTCVALNPVARQVAFGNVGGEVEVWAFPDEPDDSAGGLTARIVERAADTLYEAFGVPRMNRIGRLDEFEGRVNAIAFSGDGLVLATAREDGEVHLWGPAPLDVDEGLRQGYTLRSRLRGHSLGVTSLAFSWDNLVIYAGGRDTTVRSWSVADGSELGVFEGHQAEVRGLAVLSDERLVAGALGGEIRVFDPYWRASRRPVSVGRGSAALFVAEEPGGGSAVAVDSAGAVLGEVSGPPREFVMPGVTAPESWTAGVLHGEQVALASDDRLIKLFDAESGGLLRELSGHDAEILSLSSDADGHHLVSGARDRNAILWSGLKGEDFDQWVVEHPRAVTGVAMAADAPAFATTDSGNTLRLWSVDDRRETRAWPVSGLGKLQCLAISHSGTRVAAGLKLYARLYSSSDVDMTTQFGPHDADVRALVFSRDEQRLFVGDANGKIYVWDVAGSESLIELEGHSAGIASLAFTADGQTLLSADERGAVLSWHSVFDAASYGVWSRSERVPLRASRMVDFFGGDLLQAASEIQLGYPGLSVDDAAAELILKQALQLEASGAAVEGD